MRHLALSMLVRGRWRDGFDQKDEIPVRGRLALGGLDAWAEGEESLEDSIPA
jgi:hypothetical protein